jgi:hypothetical protein
MQSTLKTVLLGGLLCLLHSSTDSLHAQPPNLPTFPPDPQLEYQSALRDLDKVLEQERVRWEWVSWVVRHPWIWLPALYFLRELFKTKGSIQPPSARCKSKDKPTFLAEVKHARPSAHG